MSERYDRCARAVWQRPCPLSRACARQLPQRGSHWHVGQLSPGRAKHDVPETVVLRCLGSQQLDKVRLSRSPLPSVARPALLRHIGPQASSKKWPGLPKPLPLGEVARRRRDGEGKPVTAKPLRSDRQTLLSERYYRSARAVWQRPCPLRRSAPALPEGEPLACRSAFVWTSEA